MLEDTEISSAPVFVGGMFKSGTTLLRAMLSQHSAIASGLETYWFSWDWEQRRGPQFQEALDRLATFFDLDREALVGLAQAAPTPEEFLDRMMRKVADRDGKRRWAEKTPGNVAHVDRIWSHWQDGQVVHIIRDPRDVFASFVEARKWDTAEEFADRWCDIVGHGERLRVRLRPAPDRYLAIRYEDLIRSPEDTMRAVVAFLGEMWEPAAGKFEGRGEDFDKVRDATGKESTTLARLRQPLGGERVGIWQRVLSESQVEGLRGAIASRGFGNLYEQIALGAAPAGF